MSDEQIADSGSEPTVSADSQEAILESFGISAKGPADPLDVIKKEASTDTGDPKEGTTPDSGSGKEGESKESKYAGKYETPEALEKGYDELFKHKATVESEAKDLRAKIAALEVRLTESGKDEGTTPKSESDSTAYNEALETLESILGEEAAQALLQINQAGNKTTEELATLKNQLASITNEQLESKFYSDHPEAKAPEIQDVIQDMIAETAKNADNPEFQMALLLDAAKGRLGEKYFAERLEAEAKGLAKKDRDKLLAGGLSVGSTTGSGQKSTSSDPKRAREREAFFGDLLSR